MLRKGAKKGTGRQQARGAQNASACQDEALLPGALGTLEGIFSLRRQLRSLQKGILCLAAANLVLLAAFLCCLLMRPEPVYFGMSRDMKLLPMTPLSKPILSEAALKNWVAEAVTMSFNLDYLNWRRQLNEARSYFTRKAFTGFALSLDREGHLPLLRQQRALMHAVVQGTPILTRSGVVRGTLVWEFELPLLVSYETSVGRISNNAVTIVCQVQRVPATDYPQGVALSSLVTTRRHSVQ